MTLWFRGDAQVREAVAARLACPAEHEPHCEFVCVRRDLLPARDELAAWSRELATDVLWMAVQPAVDAFEYVHYRGGASLRVLIYGSRVERLWEVIEGHPQPWEMWRRPPKLGSGNFSFHGDPAAEVTRHYRLAGMGVPEARQPPPKKRPQARPSKSEKRRKPNP
ncbi:MAG: hypothetical protein KF773_01230 [Deltaproteobacteria bacterium]|nr:hypothetical protein [Deltaproteobacteria bacterium]